MEKEKKSGSGAKVAVAAGAAAAVGATIPKAAYAAHRLHQAFSSDAEGDEAVTSEQHVAEAHDASHESDDVQLVEGPQGEPGVDVVGFEYEGREGALFDADGDGIADAMGYDANGDGVLGENEILDVSDEYISMNGGQTEDYSQSGADMDVIDFVYEGNAAAVVDVNADGVADVLGYDANGNGVLDEGEVLDISGDHILMSDVASEVGDLAYDGGDYVNDANVGDYV